MWLLLLILLGLGGCFTITLIFSLLSAGRRADEGEERILLELMSSASPDEEKDTVRAQTGYASPSSKVAVVK